MQRVTVMQKNGKGRMILFSMLKTLGWLLAAATLLSAALALEIRWNLFNWNPVCEIEAISLFVISGLAIAGMWLLSCRTRDRASQIISLLICLVLLVYGCYAAFPETLSPNMLGGRDRVSLPWYRIVRCFVFAVPTIFWLRGQLRIRRARHSNRHIAAPAR